MQNIAVNAKKTITLFYCATVDRQINELASTLVDLYYFVNVVHFKR